MNNEVKGFLVLLDLLTYSWMMGLGFLFALFIGFSFYVHGTRKEKKISKRFALLPVLTSNQKFLWLRFYIRYQEFSPGVCLGGTIRPTYSGKKNRYVAWHGSGSFIPSYETKYRGLSMFGIRPILKKDGFKGEVRKKRERAKNRADFEKFFGKEFTQKWWGNNAL